MAQIRRYRRWLYALAVAALLGQMAAAMITTAVQQTPTVDEPVYVGTAVVYYQQHSLRYNPEHPPLGKLIIGAGLAFAAPSFDPTFRGNQTALGRRVLYESGNDPWRLMLFARLPVILLTLLFGLVVFAFARDLVGAVGRPAGGAVGGAGALGGLVALALYTFSPDVIAHGSLATLDVPAAGFLLTSVWLLWRARRRPLIYLPLAGLALGAAVATKMSALAAAPVLLPLAVLSVWHAGRAAPAAAEPTGPAGDARRRTVRLLGLGLLAAAGVALIMIIVVWASYLVIDPRPRWTGNGRAIAGLRGLLVDWLPFPGRFKDGVRVQLRFESRDFRGYLFGRQYRGALWYYLPAALVVKTPLGALALWLIAAVTMALRRAWAAIAYVLVPTAVLLVAAMGGERNFGVRYVIFVPMFLAVAAAAVVTWRWRWARVAAAALVVFVAVSSVRTFPHYLPYSNEAFGGPAKTYLRLHDSNVDWGQDLGRLADHLRRHYPGQRVFLLYQGGGQPSWYGIDATNPLDVERSEVRGLVVISNTWIDKADGRLATLINTSRPIDQVGHSITIFRR